MKNKITKNLILFLAITFVVTWGIAAILIFFPEQVAGIFGELSISNPLFILAVYSPGLAGIFMVWKMYGIKGLPSFFRRLTLWRGPAWGWIFVVLGIPAIMYVGAIFNSTISDSFPFSHWRLAITALALTLFLGPVEEFGWRGLALPLLQRRFAPFWAGLILGVIWMIWHIPAFLIGGTPQSAWSFFPYFVGGISISLIMTILFNKFRGSLLIAALIHFQLNNPIWPDAQPWDNYIVLFIVIIIILLNRHTVFKKGTGITDVLLPNDIVATKKL